MPVSVHIQILKAEDARRYDKTLEDLMNGANESVQIRAILAAGRIGDEKAIPRIVSLLENGSVKVREMAAFALGEIDSANAADTILKALGKIRDAELKAETRAVASVSTVTARLVEAAGKIAAANEKDAKAKELGEAILDTLEAEDNKGVKQDRTVVRLALTAALRARPEDADLVVMKFLTNLDAGIRADAANTLARLRTKSANPALRAIVMSDDDPVARANAVRALGAAEDKESLNILIDAATEDDDSRVRVSAIRALASLKDPYAVEKLLGRGETLLKEMKAEPSYVRRKRWEHRNTARQKNELLEISTTVGRLLPNLADTNAVKFLLEVGSTDKYTSPEVTIALASVSPASLFAIKHEQTPCFGIGRMPGCGVYWAARAQGMQELSKLPRENSFRQTAEKDLESAVRHQKSSEFVTHFDINGVPDNLRALASFKPQKIDEIILPYLDWQDVIVRATAAELLAELPVSKTKVDALKSAFTRVLVKDKGYNDAQLGILDALYKLDKKEAVESLLTALNAPDYLVRKKAFELLADKDLQKDFPGIAASLANARMNRKDQVLPYAPDFGTKLGQVLNTDAYYRRAISRKNGSVKAVFTTVKGVFTIDLLPEDAPLTVDNFVKLAKSRYFNGLEIHRVVPNFVMQDGDPRGDGNGGPGWSIRCEVNMVPYDRGAVGMALSGKDTGGSQWFATHSPQPHLDGGYTVFGRVNETGMKVVDNIVRGDKIISVRIEEGISPQKGSKGRKK